ncbi:site-specific integrase [Bacillus sp. FJAT-27251]|uniref:tyrosine-type recombinase/integrase n=1 Tax=Bacillus sp. FJAT-27251 TaxID=1684142 RepID=UPI0006A7C3DA|nr:site-specific integrase [Bacillus sp. FJAT-27251]
MAGSIHKYQTKKGETRYMVMLEVGNNGKRKQKKKMGFKTKKEANTFLIEALNDINKGTYIEPSRILFSEFLEEWFKTKQISLGTQTKSVHKNYLYKYIIPSLGHIPLSQLKTIHINNFINEMNQRKYSPATIKKAVNIIKNSLEFGIDIEMINKNVAKKATLPKEIKNEMKVWNQEEVNKFLKVAKGSRYYPFFYLALMTGMRKGEILALRWKDIDLENMLLTINQTLTQDGKEFIAGAKTKASNRTMDLSESTVKILKAHKVLIQQEKLALGKDYVNHDLVICTQIGTPVHSSNLRNRVFNQLIKEAEVSKIRLHDLRHTHATLLLSVGVNVKVISERLGHSSIKITLDTYSHVLPTMQKEAVKKLDDMLTL